VGVVCGELGSDCFSNVGYAYGFVLANSVGCVGCICIGGYVMNRDCVIVGFFMGFLVCLLILCVVEKYYPKPNVCEVSVGYMGGKEVHVRYGVIVQGEM
jgi:hypothetical protein